MEQFKQTKPGTPEWRLLLDSITRITVARYSQRKKNPVKNGPGRPPKIKLPIEGGGNLQDFLDDMEQPETST
jgi:hypothetical protein